MRPSKQISAPGVQATGAKSSCTGKHRQGSLPKVFFQRFTFERPSTGSAHCAERSGTSRRAGRGRGNRGAPCGDAQPQARLLPTGAHSRRALEVTYRARQLGWPGPEIDHLHQGVHGAVRQSVRRVCRRGPIAWAAQVLQPAPAPFSCSAEPAPPLARAVAGLALIGPCKGARIPIGRATQWRLRSCCSSSRLQFQPLF